MMTVTIFMMTGIIFMMTVVIFMMTVVIFMMTVIFAVASTNNQWTIRALNKARRGRSMKVL